MVKEQRALCSGGLVVEVEAAVLSEVGFESGPWPAAGITPTLLF